MKEHSKGFFSKVEKSLLITVVGVFLLFSLAIGVVLIAPGYVDPSWIEPSSYYQKQMYEVADPNVFLNAAHPGEETLQFVLCLTDNYSLLSFEEAENVRIITSNASLEKFITKINETPLKLTSKLLLLRSPEEGGKESEAQAKALQAKLQEEWLKKHKDVADVHASMPYFTILELYVPGGTQCFAIAETDEVVNCWVDKDYVIVDAQLNTAYHKDPGVIYTKNPREYRVSFLKNGSSQSFQYDPNGRKISSIKELTNKEFGFMSRATLIKMGEDIFKIEGCWYCHTDQSRTLIQDCVANGSDSYPAPPSSANEYIYQEVTFPGTRRIGPDLARVGVKRPSRDWHKAHFWSPKTKSKGSIMPAFRHFFDEDSNAKNLYGVPNYKFEAIFQYLMTKGTRITPPTESWWLGLDPIQTLKILDGKGVHEEKK
ncbi:MAG: cbb3-type cytochrome c oxidase subunit II [Chlamydiales bacterium]|nr:cbb3-type cytochrome c oxidase subunit II [Chlamydiales bacterium]